MNLRRLSCIAAVAASAAVFQISHVPLRGQDDPLAAKAKEKAKRISGAAPRLADGKPDLSDVWGSDRPFVVDIRGAVTKGETLPMNDWAQGVMKNPQIGG